jgi:molecular chaperone GrpE
VENKETVQTEETKAEERAEATSADTGVQDPTYTETANEETTSQGESNGAELDLSAEVEKLQGELEDQQQKALRAQADFDNFRRRTRQEKEEFAKYASKQLIEQLLPVYDNFDRALQTSKDTQDFEALFKGVDMIYRQFSQILEQEGLKPLEVVGEPFNPEIHQAIMQVETDEYEEGIVVEEVQRGYILKDKVIRPAMVKVSS